MTPSTAILDERRFDRLRQTHLFRGGRFDRWPQTTLGVVGAGLVGYRFALEAVLSGAMVRVYDFDVGKPENGGTQFARPGVRKVDSLVAACDAIAPGRAVGVACDVRHAGVGELDRLDILVDCSDDPALAVPLTRLSNGLGFPLLRLAVDGSGELEMGRVRCSHGAAGFACQMCAYDFNDLFRPTRRTPCPGQPAGAPAPTIAGGALAAAVAGFGLVQAQRLATGNDLDQVVDREIVLNMTHWNLLPIVAPRSQACLSGHVRWSLTAFGRLAGELTFADLFAEAQGRLGNRPASLEPYGHSLCVEAVCDCGARRRAIGTRWASPPTCTDCQGTMRWFEPTQRVAVEKRDIEELGIERTCLSELGLPETGAMFVARTAGRPPLRLLLD